jgi:hypothetical protein
MGYVVGAATASLNFQNGKKVTHFADRRIARLSSALATPAQDINRRDEARDHVLDDVATQGDPSGPRLGRDALRTVLDTLHVALPASAAGCLVIKAGIVAAAALAAGRFGATTRHPQILFP